MDNSWLSESAARRLNAALFDLLGCEDQALVQEAVSAINDFTRLRVMPPADTSPRAPVKRFGYRSAKVTGFVVSLRYESGDEIDEWRDLLSSRAGDQKDNHETYLITNTDGTTLSVQFSDWHASIGTGVREERW